MFAQLGRSGGLSGILRLVRIVDVIAAKRDGLALSREQIDFVVAGVTDGSLPDYQISALLMAIVLRGMTPEETWWLTDAMVRSGARVDLSDIPGIKVGKHSTGGVGDKTSIILAPLAASCGVVVPKMSGRGLGHTGGTLDKLESIPGFRISLSLDEFRRMLGEVGTSLIGQTPAIAPADKKLYALRDVTATIESIPLISASVMSKKLAEGANAVVLDVKVGRGAFMKREEDARRLAQSLVSIGALGGVRTEAFITRMDQPLGRAVGNALEIAECIETLKGRGPKDLEGLAVRIASRMVEIAGQAPDAASAERRVRAALASGAGLEKLRQVIRFQGGDASVVDDPAALPAAPHRHTLTAPRSGCLHALDAELVGRATVALGAGRNKVGDPVDHAVGAIVRARVGDTLRAGDPVLDLHYRDEATLAAALDLATRAIVIGDEPVPEPPLIVAHVDAA